MLASLHHCNPYNVMQALRNIVNRSQQRAVEIFSQLDRRLKSVDEKSQLGVKGQVGDGVAEEGKR